MPTLESIEAQADLVGAPIRWDASIHLQSLTIPMDLLTPCSVAMIWVQGLSRLSILGNSFEAYRIRILSPRKLECCCISRLGEEHCQEQRLPTCPHGEAAFNDTCFHTFSPPIS
jgi:hypothetical protein